MLIDLLSDLTQQVVRVQLVERLSLSSLEHPYFQLKVGMCSWLCGVLNAFTNFLLFC